MAQDLDSLISDFDVEVKFSVDDQPSISEVTQLSEGGTSYIEGQPVDI